MLKNVVKCVKILKNVEKKHIGEEGGFSLHRNFIDEYLRHLNFISLLFFCIKFFRSFHVVPKHIIKNSNKSK